MPTLEITTMVGCPLMCSFCPQDKLKASYGHNEKYLSLENFCAVLAKVPKHVRIDFSGMSEPWANPAATLMLAETLTRGYNIAVYTTLVGMKLTDAVEVAEWLKDHHEQVEILVIHLPDANGNMRGFKATDEYRKVLGIFINLSQHLRAFDMMTMDSSQRPHPVITPYLPKELSGWNPLTRAGSLDVAEIGAQEIEQRPRISTPVSCSYTHAYDHNVLLPNGDVVLCCMDYAMKHKVGNLLEQDYYDIFASPGMGLIHRENAKAEFSERTICKSCSRAKTYRTDNHSRQFWQQA